MSLSPSSPLKINKTHAVLPHNHHQIIMASLSVFNSRWFIHEWNLLFLSHFLLPSSNTCKIFTFAKLSPFYLITQSSLSPNAKIQPKLCLQSSQRASDNVIDSPFLVCYLSKNHDLHNDLNKHHESSTFSKQPKKYTQNKSTVERNKSPLHSCMHDYPDIMLPDNLQT